MKWLKKYHTYIKETKGSNLIDTILDKINDVGYENLTDEERVVLDNLSQTNTEATIEAEAIAWLNKNYGNLERVEGTRSSIGRIVSSEYFVKNDTPYLELEKSVKVLGVERRSHVMYVDMEIWSHLFKFGLTNDEIIEVLKTWLDDCYNVDVVKIRQKF